MFFTDAYPVGTEYLFNVVKSKISICDQISFLRLLKIVLIIHCGDKKYSK